MTQIRLDRARVVAVVGKLLAAGMAEHVRMDLEPDLLQQLSKTQRGKTGTSAFRGQEEGRGSLALQLPQGPQLVA